MSDSYSFDFNDFVVELKTRLQAGADEYGDLSFSSDPKELVKEIQEELLDVANWSFILYCRLNAIKRTL